MEAFAVEWLAVNPENGIFSDADTIYILSFGIIMLNTDSHNPQIKKKMTQDQFLKNFLGFPQAIPPSYLEGIFQSVVDEEIGLIRHNAIKLSTVASSKDYIFICLTCRLVHGWRYEMGIL